MKRATAIILALALLACTGVTALAAGDTDSAVEDYENNQVFVEHTDGTCEVVTYPDGDALEAGVLALSADPSVAYIQPNVTYTAASLATSDTYAAQQWALSNDGSFQAADSASDGLADWLTGPLPGWQSPFPDGGAVWRHDTVTGGGAVSAVAGIDIGAETAWSIYDGGSRQVIIALIDTGVDYTHEDLTDVIWVNSDETPGNGIDDDGNGYIDDVYGWNFYSDNNNVYVGSEDSHGTHGAGTMAARSDNGVGIAGIVNSDNVKIMVLKALGGQDGAGSTQSVISAIQYAEANGASICNLSFGSEYNDQALYRAIARSNMLFVAAAGNDGTDTDSVPCYPASYDLDNIISVANLNCDGALHYSSSYGAATVDIAAPGTSIISTTPGGGYEYMTGTSMAAPMVTASAAMLYSYFPDMTLADVKDALLSTSRALTSLEGKTVTGGMLDLGAAMSLNPATLSHRDWTLPELGDGAAPEITVQKLTLPGVNGITVRVTDADGDLTVTAYAPGALTAADFAGGTAGQTFTVDSAGTASFLINGSGDITFYARDSAGNETVCTYTVAQSSPIHGRFGFWF